MLEEWVFEANDPMQARLHRREFMQLLRSVGAQGSDFESAEIVYGELVGNVIRHVGGHIRIALRWRDEQAVLSVRDVGCGFTLDDQIPDDSLERGRGLFIVRQIVRELNIRREPNGCRVEAVLNVRRRPAA